MRLFNKKPVDNVVDISGGKVRRQRFFGKGYAVNNPKHPLEVIGEGLERPNVDIRKAKEESVALCRTEAQQNPYISGFIRLAQNSVVGPNGIRLKSLHKDQRVQEDIEHHWKYWSRRENVDIAGRDDLVEIQKIALADLMTVGEFIAIKHFDTERMTFKLQIVDPLDLDVGLNSPKQRTHFNIFAGNDRTLNPIRMGIEMDRYGKPLMYWFDDTKLKLEEQSGYHRSIDDYQGIPAGRVIHISLNDIGKNFRGMPYIANTIVPAAALRAYEATVRVRAHINAKRIAVLETAADDINPRNKGMTKEEIDQASEDIMTGLQKQMRGDSDIGLVDLLEGQSMKDWNSSVPDNTYPAFKRTHLEAIAASLGVSYHMFTGDIAGATFSSGRLGEVKTRDTWLRFRSILIEQLMEPLFDEWVSFYFENFRGTQGGVSPDEALKHKFIGKGFAHIQPREQAEAAQKQIETKQKAVSEFIIEDGRDPKEVYEMIAKDEEMWKELGIQQVMNPIVSTPPQDEPPPPERN